MSTLYANNIFRCILKYMKDFERTGNKLLTAVAYGDAAGLPVEAKSATYIAMRYGAITQLIPPVENPFYSGDLPEGTWSDDTHLSLAVTKAIIKANGFDLQLQAESHIDAYHETPLVISPNGKESKQGWGGSTTRSVERMIGGTPPQSAGEIEGAGNGILMKMAPLVFWQAAKGMDESERYVQYDQLTTMTHDSDVARICTRVHGNSLHYLLTQQYDPSEFIDYIVDAAVYHETLFEQDGRVSSHLRYLQQNSHPSSQQILDQFENTKSGFKYGFYAPETLAIAYGVFMTHSPDFKKSVFSAVNIGGDSDSTASIVASMVNFSCKGELNLPDDYSKVADRMQLEKVAQQLTALALKHN
ncbi:MAG: ADP-ribosylglycohydrolase [Candidatus Saccharibacteria bacterium]|nr:ADP-ribosylglycohydrolase [Candidatus Saccharibacteria bacterium]